MKQKLHNPKGILVPLLIAAVLFGGYFAYYSLLASKALVQIKAQKRKTIKYAKIEKSGFPYRLSFRFYDVTLGNLKIGSLRATASPFEPQNWVIDEASNLQFSNQGDVYTLSPSNLKCSFKFDVDNRDISHFAIDMDALAISFGGNKSYQLEKTKTQLVREFGAMPRQALNIEIAKLDTNNSLLGVELDFTDLVLRGPIVIKNAQKSLEIMYGVAKLSAGEISDIKGNITLSSNAKFNGTLEFCFAPSKEIGPNIEKICSLKAKIVNSNIAPDFSALIPLREPE